jgi:hypothetical protein
MDISHITAAQAQGAQGEHHHRTTIGDRISKIESAMDDAIASGTLTGDQAIQMKKELDDIKKMLNHDRHKQNGSNDQTGSSTALQANDREKIRSDLKELEKQFSAALKPKGATDVPTAASRRPKLEVNELFRLMDTNSDGKIGKEELTSYINRTANFYGQKGSMTINVTITSQFNTIT